MKNFLVALILGLFGIALNYCTLPLIDPIEFLLSPAIAFVAMRLLPLRFALITLLMILVNLSWQWQSIQNTSLYLMEFFALYFGYRKGWNLFYTNLIYWMLIGIPVAAILIYAAGIPLETLGTIILLKQPINGVLNVLIANIMVLMPIKRWLGGELDKKATLQSFIKDVLMAILLLPIFSLFFVLKENIEQQAVEQVKQNNQSFASIALYTIDDFLSSYRQAMLALARLMENPWQLSRESLQTKLLQYHSVYDGFLTMLIADEAGQLQFSSPKDLIAKGTAVSDREYFIEPKKNLRPFISDVFMGRGFGNDTIVAISAPLLDKDNNFVGIVEGSLNLYQLDLLLYMPDVLSSSVMVLDNNDRVIFSSPELQLDFLQVIKPVVREDKHLEYVVDLGVTDKLYSFANTVTRQNWQVYFLNDRQTFINQMSISFRRLMILALMVILATLLIAQLLAYYSNRPIKSLLSKFSRLSLTDISESERQQNVQAFEELQLLFDKFEDAKEKIVHYHKDAQLALTDKISAEKESDAKSELLSKVSHELRTPLNAILGQVQLLKMEDLKEEHIEQLEDIEKAGKFLVFLIEDLLLMSKSEMGKLSISRHPIKLNELIYSSLKLFDKEFGRNSIELTVDVDATQNSQVYADAKRLQQALNNLISNSIKYNKENGRVFVETKVSNNCVTIRVKDTGVGIAPEYKDKVFLPFHRLSFEHSDIEGSGIGLSLASRLIHLMEGTLTFESVENKGSEFIIELPLLDDKTKIATPEQEEVISIGSLEPFQFLYIEDNKTNFMVLNAWLKKKQAGQVVGAINGNDALTKLKHDTFDFIFMDMGLPDINGRELIKKVRELGVTTPVVALTADGSEQLKEQSQSLGFDAFLTKPVDFVLVERTIYHLLLER